MSGTTDVFLELVESQPRLRSMKDVPRNPMKVRYMPIGAACSAIVSVGWLIAPLFLVRSLEDFEDTTVVGEVLSYGSLAIAPLVTLYLALRVLFDSERVGESTALVMLHALMIPISMALTPVLGMTPLGAASGYASTALNAAVLFLFWAECKRWSRF